MIDRENMENIQRILSYIKNCSEISALTVLNYLQENKNIPYKYIKDYFISKLEKDSDQIIIDRRKIKDNISYIKNAKQKFRNLKTKVTNFQPQICNECGEELELPTINFLCGHSFHEECLGPFDQMYECSKCFDGEDTKNMQILEQIQIKEEKRKRREESIQFSDEKNQ